MQIIKNLNEISNKRVALTIGNFDGVHQGHCEILAKIQKRCKKDGLVFAVMTFVPHPMQILKPQRNFLLNSYRERRGLLRSCGVEALMEIDFDRDLSTMNPGEFIERYILNAENVDVFFIGHDFAFGANKKGNHEFISDYCKNKDIEIIKLEEFVTSESDVSSSRIRKLIDEGSLAEANVLLDREFFISGRVIKGEGRGKQIGIPTANLSFDDDRKIPLGGVYISQTEVGNQKWHSITNIGNNPTFNETKSLFVETHIFDFDNDIYGEEIKVSIIERIRDEKKFSSVNELITQINLDIELSKEYFKNA